MKEDNKIDVNKLKGIIVANGLTQKQLAKQLEIAENTLSRKMQRGVFTSVEMNKMIKILKIENPGEVFFNL